MNVLVVGMLYAQLVPAGPEFAVGTSTSTVGKTIRSSSPAVAVGPAGDFVVVWSRGEYRQTYFGYPSAFGQRFNAAGVPLGDEFPVSSGNIEWGSGPAVAVQSTGEFVVLWDEYQVSRVRGARFDAARLGSEFAINATGSASQPAVAADPMGGFVVVWEEYARQDGSSPDASLGVFGRRYDAGGSPVGNGFLVNTYTTGHQGNPAVASDTAGGFVVVWASRPSSRGYPQPPEGVMGIFGQRYDATGARVGGEFAVNTDTTGNQASLEVASDPTGGFVVVWSSEDDDHNNARVSGRRFDSGGSPIGGEFAVGTDTAYRQTDPDVAVDPTGGFLIVWSSQAPDRSTVLGQQYDAAGVPVGSELAFPSHGVGSFQPTVAADPAGGFVVVQTANYDDEGSRLFGQRLVPAGTPDANIAPDPDFETDPAFFYFGRGPCSFSWADDVTHSTTHALKIDSQTSELCRWLSETSAIPVNPGESYDVSAWMRTDGSQPAGVLSVKFWTAAAVHTGGTVYAPHALSGPHDWTQLTLSTTALPEAAFMRIELRLNGPGTLWADDVRVTVGAPVAKSPPVVKGRLEEGLTVRTTLGSWTGTPTDFRVQWIACGPWYTGANRVCEEIAGATGTSYTLTAAEVDKSIKTVVWATGFGRTGEAFSTQRGPVLQATPTSGNLARDADMELDPAPYYFTNGDGSCGSEWQLLDEFSGRSPHSPTHALLISSATTALCRSFTKPTLIAVEPGSRYTVSAWFRTELVNGNGRLGLNFWTKGLQYIAPTILSNRTVKGTQDWTQLEVQATAPPAAAYLRVEFRLNGPGTLWVDDLFVTRRQGGGGGGGVSIIVPYQDTDYRYEVVSQGSGAGFEEMDFDDSTWSTGAANFGFGCGATAGTDWPTDTDILLRKHFHVPEGTTGVAVAAVVDNDVQIFLNGLDVSGGLQMHEDCADYSNPFVFSVPREVLRTGDNLLAVRGRDRGTVSFLDIQISGSILP